MAAWFQRESLNTEYNGKNEGTVILSECLILLEEHFCKKELLVDNGKIISFIQNLF